MANLIDRDSLLVQLEDRQAFLVKEWGYRDHYTRGFEEATDKVGNAPSVDAVEVVHGRWENITGGMITLGDCSECKVRQPVIGTNYCKNCGAKMHDRNNIPREN